MRLNTIAPKAGSKTARRRVGRGIGSGLGKTCGRGHKGQHARAGGFHKVGFEGGQMPLQRRLPKVGFRSRKARTTAEVRLHELERLATLEVTPSTLKAAGLVPQNALRVRIFLKGTASRPFQVRGISVTRGARELIIAAGGMVHDPEPDQSKDNSGAVAEEA